MHYNGSMDIVYKSLIAAIITAVILVIEKHSGPRIAGAIGGIPIVFAISYVLVTYQLKDVPQMNEFLWGGVIGAVGGVLFSFILIFLNTKFSQYYWFNFMGAYALIFLFALVASQISSKT